MYKIQSNVGEIKQCCKAFLLHRKEIVKNRRVKYIHEHLNDRNIFGKKKYKSVKDVVRYMKKEIDLFDNIWVNLWFRGSHWESEANDLLQSIKHLPDERIIYLTEDMVFILSYKE